MSHFYGTLKGNRGEATRCGTKGSGIDTYAASWRGTIHVRVFYNEKTGKDMCIVAKTTWRGAGEHKILYSGPVGKEAE